MSELNLIPSSLKGKRRKKQNSTLITEIVIIVAALMFFGVYFPLMFEGRLHNSEADLKKQVDSQSYIIQERDNLKAQIDNINDHINKVDSMTKSKVVTYSLIQGLQKSMPKDVILNNLNYSQGIININGTSNKYNSPSEFVANLQTSDLYSNSKLVSLSANPAGNKFSFVVKITLGGVTP